MKNLVLTLEEYKEKEEENQLLLDEIEKGEMDEGIIKTIRRGLGNAQMLFKSPIDKKIMLVKRKIIDANQKLKKENTDYILSKREKDENKSNKHKENIENLKSEIQEYSKKLAEYKNDKVNIKKDNKNIKSNQNKSLNPKKGIFTQKYGSTL